MSIVTRKVYDQCQMTFGKASDILPDMQIAPVGPLPNAQGNGQPPEAFALVFIAANGEHSDATAILLTDEGRRNLIRILSGGIEVVGAHELPAAPAE